MRFYKVQQKKSIDFEFGDTLRKIILIRELNKAGFNPTHAGQVYLAGKHDNDFVYIQDLNNESINTLIDKNLCVKFLEYVKEEIWLD